jgi:hypothetical protein
VHIAKRGFRKVLRGYGISAGCFLEFPSDAVGRAPLESNGRAEPEEAGVERNASEGGAKRCRAATPQGSLATSTAS